MSGRRPQRLLLAVALLAATALACPTTVPGIAPADAGHAGEDGEDGRDAGDRTPDAGLDPGGDAMVDRPPTVCGPEETACGVLCVDLQTDPTNCGACGRTCVLPNALAACEAGACAVGECEEDHLDADGDASNGCERRDTCTPGQACQTGCGTASETDCVDGLAVCATPPESCNATDDDCDGDCDEGPLPGCRVGVHRGSGNGHVYSTDQAFVSSAPYHLESANYFHLYAAAAPGTRPVFLCRKPNGKRFLSADTACEITVAPERQLGFWATEPRCGAVPLYRLYNGAEGNHFYTTSAGERDNARDNLGYREEGVAGYVWRAP